MTSSPPKSPPIAAWKLAVPGLGAAVSYWIVFSTTHGAAMILVALPCVFLLHRARTTRQAFYAGLFTGIAMYAPPLAFFYRVFGPAALALYLIAGLPIAFFVALMHLAHRRISPGWMVLLTPILWTGIEYFRSELYWLRFAWLLPGQAVAFVPGIRWVAIGVYGVGFILALVASLIVSWRRLQRRVGILAALVVAILMYWPPLPSDDPAGPLHVAGVQLEFPSTAAAVDGLDRLAIAHPEAQILVLSEYSFYGPVPQAVRDVIHRHHRYLIAGGVRPLVGDTYDDTAFVIGPDGNDVFSQGKSVPVQFMVDGSPARERHVWNSPWGKIGIAVCYDVSYARVMDDFVRQGAQGLIIPTEDAQSWGKFERVMLHGRMAPIRAAEYHIPMLGVWSSGISQLTDADGRVVATAGYPGQGDMIAGAFALKEAGRVPPDRMFATACVVVVALLAIYLCIATRLTGQAINSAGKSAVTRPPPGVQATGDIASHF